MDVNISGISFLFLTYSYVEFDIIFDNTDKSLFTLKFRTLFNIISVLTFLFVLIYSTIAFSWIYLLGIVLLPLLSMFSINPFKIVFGLYFQNFFPFLYIGNFIWFIIAIS